MLRAVATPSAASVGAIPESEKGQPNGVATLGPDGKVPASELSPAHDVGKAASQAEMLALVVDAPAECIRTDFNPPHIFYLSADPASDINNWHDLGALAAGAANPTATVGPAAKNGAAATYMRSDAAPAIDLAAAYPWTGTHSWSSSGHSTTVVPGQIVTHRTTAAHPSQGSASGLVIQETDLAGYQAAIGLRSMNAWGNISQGTGHMDFSFSNGAGTIEAYVEKKWLTANGDFNNVTGIVSSSGTGTWVHTGGFTVNGIPSWSGANNPWTVNGGTGVPGQFLMSTGNATSPSWQSAIRVVAADGKSAQTADINAPTLYAVPTSGLYRVSAYVVVSQAATTSSTMPNVSVSYTEATTGVAVQDQVTQTAATNQVGLHSGGTAVIAAQQGSNIGYVTSNYASSGATPMQYAVQIKIESVG